MSFLNSHLTSTMGPFDGFLGEHKKTKDIIALLITLSEDDCLYNTMIDFIIVNAPATYNTIFNKTLLNTFQAIVFT